MSTNLLELRGVQTHIGAYHILHGVDFDVPQGEVTMLLGRNGAGKTTTLRTIMGLWHASQGSVTLDGQDITRRATPDIARRGIAYVPENMGIFTDLTVRENMVLAARSARHEDELDKARLDWIFGLFPALKKFWLYPAGKLSGGQKQMLAVARAICEPRALILIVCFVFRNMPVGVRSGIAAMSQLDKSLDEASLMLRANSFMTVRRVILPLLRPAIVSALVYSFVRSITSISAVIFLVSAQYNMATAYIVGLVENGQYGVAIAYSSALIVVMIVIIGMFQAIVGERRLRRETRLSLPPVTTKSKESLA